MDYELLKKAYDAVEMLNALNLPVSDEQLRGIADLERSYLRENVIPAMKKEIEPFLSSLRNPIKLNVTYSNSEGFVFSFENRMQRDDAAKNEGSFSRDRSKYSIDGGQPLNKRRFVLAVVKEYVKNNPDVSLEDLEKRFPSSLSNSPLHGVVRNYELIKAKIENQPDLLKRFMLEPDDIITLKDGTKVVVYNQWGTEFDRFLSVARELHTVESYLSS